MKDFLNSLRAVVFAGAVALLAMLPSEGALAQVVVQLPAFAAPRTVLDLGNGPLETHMIAGNMFMFTSSGSGLGSTSGSSTTLTLTATPTVNIPLVGGIISGTGITSGTTVAAFNGTTTITLSAAMTVAASTPLAWGSACPVSTMAAPAQPPAGNLMAALQTGDNLDMPWYTQARMCAYGGQGPGGQFLVFPIGAH